MQLKIEYVPLDEVKTYANNAKLHPAEQIEQIKKSISEFGMNDPIAVWKNNEIIEGHGRLIACLELAKEGHDELKEIPIIRLDDLTDEQRKAYALVHNKLTMNSDFDMDALQEELESITDLDMSEYGFDLSEDEIEDSGALEDEEPEVPFTEELLEENNYVVLWFDNSVDWLQAQSLLGLKPVKALDSKKGFERIGMGRVINGRDVMERLAQS